MIVWAPYYRPWDERSIAIWLASDDWRSRYFARSAESCAAAFNAALATLPFSEIRGEQTNRNNSCPQALHLERLP